MTPELRKGTLKQTYHFFLVKMLTQSTPSPEILSASMTKKQHLRRE
jgi:hypothetical protein